MHLYITPLAKGLCDTPLVLLTLKFHDLHPFLIYTPTSSVYAHPIFNCVVMHVHNFQEAGEIVWPATRPVHARHPRDAHVGRVRDAHNDWSRSTQAHKLRDTHANWFMDSHADRFRDA